MGRVEKISDAQASDLAQETGVSSKAVQNYVKFSWDSLKGSILKEDAEGTFYLTPCNHLSKGLSLLAEFPRLPKAKLETLVKRYMEGIIKDSASCKTKAMELDLKFAPVLRWFKHRRAKDKEEALGAPSAAVLRQRALDAMAAAQVEPIKPTVLANALFARRSGAVEQRRADEGGMEPAKAATRVQHSTPSIPKSEYMSRSSSPEVPLSSMVASRFQNEMPTPSFGLHPAEPSFSMKPDVQAGVLDNIVRSISPSPPRPRTPDSSIGKNVSGGLGSPFGERPYRYVEEGIARRAQAGPGSPAILVPSRSALLYGKGFPETQRATSIRPTYKVRAELGLHQNRLSNVHYSPYPPATLRRANGEPSGSRQSNVSVAAGVNHPRMAKAESGQSVETDPERQEIVLLNLDARQKRILSLKNELARLEARKA